MKATHGLSLLELLITMLILSILLTIAYPAYTAHITKIHRAEAKVALLDLAARLEQYYNFHNTYSGATLENLAVPKTNFYQLEINNADETTYLINATPMDSQQKNDPHCGAFSLDQLGNKTISGDGDSNECWQN